MRLARDLALVDAHLFADDLDYFMLNIFCHAYSTCPAKSSIPKATRPWVWKLYLCPATLQTPVGGGGLRGGGIIQKNHPTPNTPHPATPHITIPPSTQITCPVI